MRFPFLFKEKEKKPEVAIEEKKARITLLKKELLSGQSVLYENSQFEPYNPAQLYQKRGGYSLYDKIRQDDQVHSVLAYKKSIILGGGWTIESEDDKVKEFWDITLREMFSDDDDMTFDGALYQILTALDYGFSISEIVVNSGPIEGFGGGNYWYLKKLKTQAPHGFEIKTDGKSNIEEIMQWGGNGQPINIPPEKVLLFVHQGEFGNPYGNADLTIAVYRSYWSKDNIIKFWNIGLERAAVPWYFGKYPENTDEETLDDFEKSLKNIQAKAAMIMDDRFDVEEKGGKTEFGEAFDRAIDKHNLLMARAMLMPDLMGMSGHQSQSGGLGGNKDQSQYDMFLGVMKSLGNKMEALLNRRIISPLTKLNFGKDVKARIKFNELTKDQKYKAANTFMDFVQKGQHTPDIDQKKWLMNILGAPIEKMEEDHAEKEKEEKERKEKEAKGLLAPGGSGSSFPPGGAGKPGMPPLPLQVPPRQSQPTPAAEPVKPKGFSVSRETNMAAETYNGKALTRFERKVNFSKIEKGLDDIQNKSKKEIAVIIKEMINDLMGKVIKRKMIENKRFDLINGLAISGDVGLRKEINAMMKNAYREGLESTVKAENMAIFDTEPMLGNADVANWLKEAAIFRTTKTSQELLEISKDTLIEGIRSGAGVKETMKMLEKEYSGWDEVGGAPRIENIVRTNTASAFNQARKMEFKKLGDTIAGYQYSAIMDGRTSEVCEALHGKVLKPDEIDAYSPPTHYQCRSLLVPIFADELESEGEQFKDFKNVNTVKTEREKGGFLKLVK